MFLDDTVIFPAVGVLLVLWLAAMIRLNFKADASFKPLHAKPDSSDGRLRAVYIPHRAFPVLLAVTAIIGYGTWQIISISNGYVSTFKPFYIISGALLMLQLLVVAFSKPFVVHNPTSVRRFKTAVILPFYNESPTSLRDGIASFFDQTVMPTEIHVVDDGSKQSYHEVKRWFCARAKELGIRATWQRQANAGKRAAQAMAMNKVTYGSQMIVVTVDSDGILDPHAIEEGLKPFVDSRVQSVAGVVVAKNAQDNLLARITDLLFVSAQQLIDRTFMSQFGEVLVNSGGLAFYRSTVVSKALEQGYTSETFMRWNVLFSDDSYLTLFALLAGRTVQQSSAIVFADMPVSLSHHVRQQLRWGRGSFIRSWWRLRFLPVGSIGYLRQLLGWMLFVSVVAVITVLFVVGPLTGKGFPPLVTLLIPFAFGLLQASQYFRIKRSDMSARSQLFTFLLSPLATVWSAVMLRSIRLYAILTCYKTGWGTRADIEILHASDKPASAG